jgi:hypothetical protein
VATTIAFVDLEYRPRWFGAGLFRRYDLEQFQLLTAGRYPDAGPRPEGSKAVVDRRRGVSQLDLAFVLFDFLSEGSLRVILLGRLDLSSLKTSESLDQEVCTERR